MALTEVEEKVPVDHVSNGVCRHPAVHVRVGGQMHLDREKKKKDSLKTDSPRRDLDGEGIKKK